MIDPKDFIGHRTKMDLFGADHEISSTDGGSGGNLTVIL